MTTGEAFVRSPEYLLLTDRMPPRPPPPPAVVVSSSRFPNLGLPMLGQRP